MKKRLLISFLVLIVSTTLIAFATPKDTAKSPAVQALQNAYEKVIGNNQAFSKFQPDSPDRSGNPWCEVEDRFSEPDPVEGGMVHLPAGNFIKGCSTWDSECEDDEKPAHQVTLSSFWMDLTEVTNEQYRLCVADGDCPPVNESECFKWNGSSWSQSGSLNSNFKGESQPVVCVNWDEASLFCNWAGKRLPSEAEWEFAARAGNERARYGKVDDIAWYTGNAGGMTHPVGQKTPNAWGLYDMLGNVWEWCSDWYDPTYFSWSPGLNPRGPSIGSERVLRGGSWTYCAAHARVSERSMLHPANRYFGVGFRCAQDE